MQRTFVFLRESFPSKLQEATENLWRHEIKPNWYLDLTSPLPAQPVCTVAHHKHTDTRIYPAAHTHIYTQVLECLTPSAPRGERFIQQQLSEEVSWDSALKVFQVIWWRCLPEVHRNGSFTFLWLESSSCPQPVQHQPHTSPGRMGGGGDSCSGGLWLCRLREMVCSNQWGE